ncbi:hypothetical protein [Hasllibacter sp. MH4015]|uniref:hypothetical protein n=1 Tax=Hasllibacter sp. MH4015 TaxID=2854029 RepID=UPI001CD78862|nr:hypothetical protein [Hasllibacter sp. MH4015]
MIRLLVAVFALIGLAACTPTTTVVGANTYSSASCFTGPHVLDLDVRVPASYGPVSELRQLANGPRGLEFTCNLVGYGYPVQDTDYPIYLGEVYGGTAGLCVSAVTTNRGRVLSCATADQVRAAINAPLGSPGATIRLTRWQSYPSS